MIWSALCINENKLQLFCFACSREGILKRVPEGCPTFAFCLPVEDNVVLMQRLVNWFNRHGVSTQLLPQTFDLIIESYNVTFGRAV